MQEPVSTRAVASSAWIGLTGSALSLLVALTARADRARLQTSCKGHNWGDSTLKPPPQEAPVWQQRGFGSRIHHTQGRSISNQNRKYHRSPDVLLRPLHSNKSPSPGKQRHLHQKRNNHLLQQYSGYLIKSWRISAVGNKHWPQLYAMPKYRKKGKVQHQIKTCSPYRQLIMPASSGDFIFHISPKAVPKLVDFLNLISGSCSGSPLLGNSESLSSAPADCAVEERTRLA